MRDLYNNGIYQSTVYLEVDETIKRHLNMATKVEVFGEFSSPNPWKVRVACHFDLRYQCYKADVKMKVGDQFKFIIKNRHETMYVVSKRYPVRSDGRGNANNVFDPKKIIWTNEKKSGK